MIKWLEALLEFMLTVIVAGLYAIIMIVMMFVFVIMLIVCIGVALLFSPLILIGLLYDKVKGIS